jgi:hypothetical protein
MGAYFQTVLDAAVDNHDPRVMHVGTIDDVTRNQWHQDARQRQIRNKERSRPL